MGIVKYGCHPENPSDPKSKWVMESAIRIEHPRKGIPAWNWEPVDERPEEGEYWNSRGPGYPDVSGFVKTKAAGERILAMVHEVLVRLNLLCHKTDGRCDESLKYHPVLQRKWWNVDFGQPYSLVA